MNLIKISNNLKGLTDDALIKEVNDPSGAAPSYMVLAELKRRQDLRKDYVPQDSGGEKTVAEELTLSDREPAQAGLAAMMPPEMGADIQRGFAVGGEVRGFDNGGGIEEEPGFFGSIADLFSLSRMREQGKKYQEAEAEKYKQATESAEKRREDRRNPKKEEPQKPAAAAAPAAKKSGIAAIAPKDERSEMEEILAGIPRSKYLEEQAKELQKAREEIAGRRNEGLNMALIQAGLGMATTPGSFLQSLVGGAQQGIGAYSAQLGAMRKDQRELLKEQSALGRAQAEEELTRQKIGTDIMGVRAARQKASAEAARSAYESTNKSREADLDNALKMTQQNPAISLDEALSMVRALKGGDSGIITRSQTKQ